MEKEQYTILQDSYLNHAMEWFHSMKKIGVFLPSMDQLLDTKMEEIYKIIKDKKLRIKDSIVAENIEEKIELERNKDALSLLRPFLYEENMRKCILYIKYCVKEIESFQSNTKQVYYTVYEDTIIPQSICVPKTQNALHSVILASTLASTLKNQNRNEFKNLCLTGEILPSFLTILFAERMAKDSQNGSMPLLVDLLSFWQLLCYLEYYEMVLTMKKTPNEQYLGRVCMLQHIYPCVNGYVDALKIWKRYQEHKKEVLKRVKNVLNGTMTTNDLLQKLDISSISTEEVLVNKVKKLDIFK